MKDRLVFALFSRHPLTETLTRLQIAALVNFDGGIACPDKWGEFEPLKRPFEAEDFSVPVGCLAKPGGTFFYRKGKPIQMSGEVWNLTHPPTARFPSPIFTNYWTGRFEARWVEKVGVPKVQECVRELFRTSGSDFGFLTTEADLKAKNTSARSQSYQGMNLEDGVPGLYWLNLFSNGFANWLGLDAFPSQLAESAVLRGDLWSIAFSDTPEHCRDIDILQKQRAAIEWLGSDRFFDMRSPDRKLNSPDWKFNPPASLT
jgi:hypothetical protein